MGTLNTKEAIEKVLKPLATKKNMKYLDYLYGRWLDEQEYEDFADYSKAMQKMATDANITFVKAQKRPFGFVVDIGRKILLYASQKQLGWKTVS